MNLYEKIINREEKISIIGLGYVGMPLAIAFAEKVDVIGFDVNREKVEMYHKGIDMTEEVGNEAVKNTTAVFCWDEKRIQDAKFHIVAVPTPTNEDKTPDLRPVIGASKTIGRNLTKGSIVVYESTVYPGLTEEICIPILEEESGLKCGVDFKIGYSPERINPGDKVHRLQNIVKVVSGMDEESLDIIAKVYELVVEAGVHRAESIKVAEASKIIENSQRDLNIAFMNEIAMIFDRMGIDTQSVIAAANTKWNFLLFEPGLVGGHCIGVDPYYLVHQAERFGHESKVIAAGRKVNDGMGKFVAEKTIKNLIKAGKNVSKAKIGILGLTFKANCPDIRNTKVIDIINELNEYGVDIKITDCMADKEEVREEYGIELVDIEEIKDVDAIIVSVGHDQYKELNFDRYRKFFKGHSKEEFKYREVAVESVDEQTSNMVLVDVKGILNKKEAEEYGYLYWRL
ncbi:nucleotide sugar dehydrogenase [Oceanirhabdus seepicola]|uniref:Nucleotide sugar dehydrogenase n=1 Tax=Oceanirhabdus seepicola TaxID=2828781 RepID=A0A9J6NZE4_9CLOT|nr:nucleotide sugar dehydrogenase [Oceanirhabdus seepicola]MCM1989350.1 nucleotide sugar dehydrogenase [Oceanirhabdus seepicola]